MKFSHEFTTEQQAEGRELALRAAGYRAWRNRRSDGMWQVFWLVDQQAPVSLAISGIRS
jgi:hypothetical protein